MKLSCQGAWLGGVVFPTHSQGLRLVKANPGHGVSCSAPSQWGWRVGPDTPTMAAVLARLGPLCRLDRMVGRCSWSLEVKEGKVGDEVIIEERLPATDYHNLLFH